MSAGWPAGTVRTLADVLAYHYQVRLGAGECSCGHVVPLGGLFPEHQVNVILDALAEDVACHEREAAANVLTLEESDKIVSHLFADGTRDGLILADLINKHFGWSARRRATRAFERSES